MKKLLVLFLVLTNTFLLSTINYVHAQEATLVKQGEWGSASYLEVVSLNGYFYAATSFGQIDVIDQEKSGVASFIAQINVEANILSMQVHNNRLAIVTEDKLSIYNISNTKTLTLNYSVELSSQHSNDKLFVSDKIYFLSDDNKVFIIQEDDGNYSIEKVIETAIADTAVIKKVILTDNYFYIASRKYNIDNSSTTTIEKYNISDNRLLESVESDSIGDFQDIISAGMDRFIVSSSGNINVLTIADNKLNIAASFTPGSQYNAFELVFKNNTLHLLSWDRVFYSYSISDSNQESLISRTPLYDFLADSSNFSQFKWSDDKLIALSGNEGIIEFVFNNEVISDIKSAYNQSGELMKGTFAGDYYLLPRSNRVDVINVADIENITLHKQTQQSTDQITTHQGAYLLNGGYSMGLYELSDEQELIQQSSVNFANHSYLVNSVQSENYIYSLDQLNDGIYLSRYNISTPDSIYETPIQLPISGYCCGFNTSMEIKNGEVLVYDSVKNGIHIFTDIENDNFSYKQFVSYPEGYTTAASLNGIIYIASKDKLTSYTLSSTNELVALDNVELSFGTELIELRAVGNSLIIQTPNELFLYELTVIEKPTLLVSFLIKNNELMNAVFQFMDNKLVATTRQSIQFYQINKAPTPLVNKITLDEDSTLESASIFTDAEADMITLTVTEQSTNGTISVDENGLTYTPNNNFNGEDTVTIKATDIHGNFIEHLVNIVVEPTNDSPVVSDESYTLMQGTIHSGELPVKDIDNDSLTYTIVTDVEHGSLTLSTDGQFSYSADAAYSGTDSVAYSVTDGVNTAQATISFTVQAKPPETEVEDSAESSGGSINSLMIFILLWNITLRFRKTNAFK